MAQSLTETGYKNVIEVIDEYFGVRVNKKFINEHYDLFQDAFPSEVDAGPECSFEGEANSSGIFDTSPRDVLGDVVARIFTSFDHWPLNMDGPKVFSKFKTELKEGARDKGVPCNI